MRCSRLDHGGHALTQQQLAGSGKRLPLRRGKPLCGTGPCLALIASLVASALVGCGSSSHSVATAASPLPGVAETGPTPSTPAPETSSTSAAEPNTSGAPDFLVTSTTQEGDKVKVDGWFGPPLPASESDVDQTALSGCPPPAPDGRAVVVRLDLTTTLESSLAAEVELATSFAQGPRRVNFVIGLSQGASCELGEPGNTNASLGTLQSQESSNFTIWVVLPDAITPDNPQPTAQTLGAEGWFMTAPEPSVNGSGFDQDQHNSITGPMVVKCDNNEESGKYISVIGTTPHRLTADNISDYDEICRL